MKTVLITGGSGMIGSRLSKLLLDKGYKVIWLSRERFVKAQIPRYRWDYRKGEIDSDALEQADIIIHLAGSNLGEGAWTRKKKQKIVESRVLTSRLILDTLIRLNKKPEIFISASAIGYYGMHTDEKVYNEDDFPAKNDFLSRTCKKWEAAAFNFTKELNIRTVVLRTSFVIHKNSHTFNKLKLPVRFGIGSPFGSGKQIFSWIHLEDLCNLYIKSIEDTSMEGVYNAVSPEHISNAEFMRCLAKEMKRPFFFPKIPSFMLRLFMGEASGMILEGSRISSRKIIDKGFIFKFITASEAIKESF